MVKWFRNPKQLFGCRISSLLALPTFFLTSYLKDKDYVRLNHIQFGVCFLEKRLFHVRCHEAIFKSILFLSFLCHHKKSLFNNFLFILFMRALSFSYANLSTRLTHLDQNQNTSFMKQTISSTRNIQWFLLMQVFTSKEVKM